MTQKHIVATTRELPPGSRKLVEVNGREIVVFNIAGEFFGVLNRCPHNGGSLCKGTLTRRITSPEPGVYETPGGAELIRCPWHGWQYDVRTGQSWCEPERARTITYPVRIARGGEIGGGEASSDDHIPQVLDQVLERGPLIAETVKVSLEEDYVVIEA
jgi:nitrite reductase/ring-hydroxylating ferredoxin subunit